MSTSHSRSVMTGFYDAANSGAVKEMFACLHDDFAMEQPPALPYGGRIQGAAGLMDVFRGVARWRDPSFGELDALIVDGDRASAVARSRVATSGVIVVAAEHWDLRDGKIVFGRVFFHDLRPILDAL